MIIFALTLQVREGANVRTQERMGYRKHSSGLQRNTAQTSLYRRASKRNGTVIPRRRANFNALSLAVDHRGRRALLRDGHPLHQARGFRGEQALYAGGGAAGLCTHWVCLALRQWLAPEWRCGHPDSAEHRARRRCRGMLSSAALALGALPGQSLCDARAEVQRQRQRPARATHAGRSEAFGCPTVADPRTHAPWLYPRGSGCRSPPCVRAC